MWRELISPIETKPRMALRRWAATSDPAFVLIAPAGAGKSIAAAAEVAASKTSAAFVGAEEVARLAGWLPSVLEAEPEDRWPRVDLLRVGLLVIDSVGLEPANKCVSLSDRLKEVVIRRRENGVRTIITTRMPRKDLCEKYAYAMTLLPAMYCLELRGTPDLRVNGGPDISSVPWPRDDDEIAHKKGDEMPWDKLAEGAENVLRRLAEEKRLH
jgi:hypothetical protein